MISEILSLIKVRLVYAGKNARWSLFLAVETGCLGTALTCGNYCFAVHHPVTSASASVEVCKMACILHSADMGAFPRYL